MTKHYEQRKEANKRYLNTQDEVKLRLPKGTKDAWRAAADRAGISMTQYVRQAVETAIERDKTNT